MRALALRLIVIEEIGNGKKNVFIKNIVQNGWRGDASPTSPPDSLHV